MRGALILSLSLLAIINTRADANEFSGKRVHFKFGVDVPGYELTFASLETPEKVKFTPNAYALLSAGASLQGYFGASYGFRASQTEEDKLKKGETKYEDYRFNFAFQEFHLSLSHSRFRGFYVQDTSAIDSAWTSEQPYYHAPLEAMTSGANFTWVFSPERFSLEAAFDQTSRQSSTGGSWLIGAAAGRTLFKNEEEIIPSALQARFGSQKHITEGRFDALTLKGGYGQTWIFGKKVFLSTALQIGFGGQAMKIKGTDFDISRTSHARKIDALMSFGYNGDDYFSGLRATGDATSYETGNIEITSTLWDVMLFFGFRI